MRSTLIRPASGWPGIPWKEVWRFRELLMFLVWRDVLVRYKQTVIGIFWAVLQPFLTMVIFTLLFGQLARMPSDGVRYSLFAFTSLVLWTFFASTAGAVSTSLSRDAALLKKIYFPRIILPGAASLGRVPDFLIAFVLLLGMILAYDHPLRIEMLLAPLFVLIALMVAFGFGMWMAALDVHFRDIRYLVPFALQLWLFASSVVYPTSMIREKWGPFWYQVHSLNPMAPVISGFRWCLLGTGEPPGANLVVAGATALLLCLTGARVLRKMEKSFSDVI